MVGWREAIAPMTRGPHEVGGLRGVPLEEFLRPYLAKTKNPQDFLKFAQRWVYFYNMLRPHTGEGMDGNPPLAALKACGYTGAERIVLFPPILLDTISTDLLLSCYSEGGNDLLAHYTRSIRMPGGRRS